MKRLFLILGRVCLFLAFAMASAIAVGGILLYALEKSGWLADYVTAEVQGRLGDSGAQFELGELELDWFGPAVTLYDLRLGIDGRLARINRLSLVVAPFAPPSSRVAPRPRSMAAACGSRPNCSRRRALAARRNPRVPARRPRARFGRRVPSARDQRSAVASAPPRGRLPLGAVEPCSRATAREAELKGGAPRLADADDRNAAVLLRGRVEQRGILSLHVSTPASRFPRRPCRRHAARRAARLQPTVRLALDAKAEISLDPRAPSNVACAPS